MEARDRLIVAMDVETVDDAVRLAERLAGSVRRLKVGLELYTTAGPEAVWRVMRPGFKVMLDLKLHDIPETVARATTRAAATGAELLTIHTAGGRKMLEAAAAAARQAGGKTKLLGVTVLTSMDDRDLAETSVEGTVEEVVRRRALLAMECGLDGVVASPREAAAIRKGAPEGFLIVTPGVRPAGAPAGDQKRVTTPKDARSAGADFVVVGRPIRDAEDPRAAADAIVADLA